MKKATNGGGYTPCGQGDAPIKEVLKLVQKNKWDIPANIEFEYHGRSAGRSAEVPGLCEGLAGMTEQSS